ncbi:MAG TPA: DUF3592 domain-containing protein, partial [Candidatus Saccharimonadales bacterium]|nr:DUF3592 domain-containing protein [Candidatus Saccharimonadales bacterium]
MTLGNLKGEATSFLNKYKSENPAAYAAAEQAVGGLLILDGFIGIDNPLGGKKRPGIFGSLTGVVVGVVFMLAPTFFGNVTGINKLTATTNATIVSVGQPQVSQTRNSNGTTSTSSSCSATAKYTVNGKTYTQQSSMSSSGMCGFTVGATIPINYDPANPGNWGSDIKTVKTIFKVFFWAGLAVVVSSIVTFLIRLASIIFGWKLLKNGRALAKTLPPGTDLSGTIKQIEHEFKTSLFGFGGGTPTAPAATPPVVPAPPAP